MSSDREWFFSAAYPGMDTLGRAKVATAGTVKASSFEEAVSLARIYLKDRNLVGATLTSMVLQPVDVLPMRARGVLAGGAR